MLKGVRKMSICSSIEENYADMLQRIHGISIWEDWPFVRANSVKIREENISAQEEAIHALENRSEILLCKIYLQNDSDIILVPCLHIATLKFCNLILY